MTSGANLFVQIAIGSRGTLGQLALAGVLPAKPMWITGTIGGGALAAMLDGKAPSLGALDYSLTAQVQSFTPAPFSVITAQAVKKDSPVWKQLRARKK